MKIIDIAIEIYGEIGEPTDTGATFISLWLRENVGMINNLLSTVFVNDTTNSEISPELSEDEKVILKQLFLIYYYNKKIRDVLIGATDDSIVEVSEGGATVRRLNKNEVAKSSGKDTIEGIYSSDNDDSIRAR